MPTSNSLEGGGELFLVILENPYPILPIETLVKESALLEISWRPKVCGSLGLSILINGG